LVSKYNIKSITDWNKRYYQIDIINQQIPRVPNDVYKNDGWTTWGDFLGTGRIADQLKVYLPYDDAVLFARNLNLKSMNEWKKWFEENKPTNLPKTPEYVYREKGWVDVNHWLRTEYLSFEDAKKVIHKMGIKTNREWRVFSKSDQLPKNIPTSPDTFYRKVWISWYDWLGTK